MADVDGIHPACAALQQHVGEAAGRGADVERYATLRIDLEMIERMGKLEPATRDIWNLRFPDLEREIRRHRLAGLVEPPLAGKNPPGEDQCLCLGPAVGEAALEEQLIEAAPRQRGLRQALAARAGSTLPRGSRVRRASVAIWPALRPASSYMPAGVP